jgi:hypothetical protein
MYLSGRALAWHAQDSELDSQHQGKRERVRAREKERESHPNNLFTTLFKVSLDLFNLTLGGCQNFKYPSDD